MTTPARIDPSSPTPLNQSLELALSRMTNALLPRSGGPVLPADAAPAPAIRLALEARVQQTEAWLRPCGEKAAKVEIAAVLGTMPSRSGSQADARAVLAVYAADLSDLPLFALGRACRAFRQGDAGDGHWAPTQAEIRILALGYADEVRAERRKIRAVLEAKVVRDRPTPEQRERVRQLAADCIADLAGSMAMREARR